MSNEFNIIKENLQFTSTATVTTQLFARGFKNTFLHGLSLFSRMSSGVMVGEAFTLRYIPAREDLDVLEVFKDANHPQRAAVEQAGKDSVLVMDCRNVDRAASIGNILATRLKTAGAAGIVTDGSIRDSQDFALLDLPTFARSKAATTNLALHHAVDFQVPISCAEVPIYPGDIIMGDSEGVVCIPRHVALEVAKAAAEQEHLEAFILSEVEAQGKLKGIYPPSEATMGLYREWAKTHPPQKLGA